MRNQLRLLIAPALFVQFSMVSGFAFAQTSTPPQTTVPEEEETLDDKPKRPVKTTRTFEGTFYFSTNVGG